MITAQGMASAAICRCMKGRSASPASPGRCRSTPGMILSNEPGFYLPDHYGIRLENLLLVQAVQLPAASKPFLGFETLTLAPFDRRLLNPALMTEPERAWLDAYHARVLHMVGPALDAAARAWLETACKPL